MNNAPSLKDFKKHRELLAGRVVKTPTDSWVSKTKDSLLGKNTHVFLKREYLQHTGSFKARGALSVMDSFSDSQLENGVVAASGGNHGIAVAYAAQAKGISAKIVVHQCINPYRYQRILDYGAHVIKIDSLAHVFDKMHEIAKQENRTPMHAFDHPLITLGAGTCGLEFMEQTQGQLDAVIVPIGGGGLCSGISCAVKRYNPNCKVYGVEPYGANSMYQSFQKGQTLRLDPPAKSIADSLSAPMSEEWSYSICNEFVDEIVLIEDEDMRKSMRLWQKEEGLIIEPACAASTAALLGPLKEKLQGQNVGLIMCGSNIDKDTYEDILCNVA